MATCACFAGVTLPGTCVRTPRPRPSRKATTSAWVPSQRPHSHSQVRPAQPYTTDLSRPITRRHHRTRPPEQPAGPHRNRTMSAVGWPFGGDISRGSSFDGGSSSSGSSDDGRRSSSSSSGDDDSGNCGSDSVSSSSSDEEAYGDGPVVKWLKMFRTTIHQVAAGDKRRWPRQPVKTILRPLTTYRYVVGMSGLQYKVAVYPKYS
ncbi:dermokine-like [Aphis craccivora]|uniref:Dermokine-like n=1 Tax=Aphis craccivora TaxID=307492 RepID=A0A6G0Z7F1_APHCR|nr:dermokine-like [Aphis craccivora]